MLSHTPTLLRCLVLPHQATLAAWHNCVCCCIINERRMGGVQLRPKPAFSLSHSSRRGAKVSVCDLADSLNPPRSVSLVALGSTSLSSRCSRGSTWTYRSELQEVSVGSRKGQSHKITTIGTKVKLEGSDHQVRLLLGSCFLS